MTRISIKKSPKQILVIGGGFAGINLAKKLADNNYYEVTLIDKNNYHFFPPLLYQVATGFLETSSISYPFRKFFRYNDNIHFRLGECTGVNTGTHTCYLDNGPLQYDYLVFAAGAVVNYYDIPNVERDAIPMKTVNDALQMRNTLLKSLEEASITKCKATQMKLLTIVVAGGGPTGVEVAGVLAELRKDMLSKDYPELRNIPAEIYLVDAAPDVLMQMSERSQLEAYNSLRRLGVEIRLNNRVVGYENDQVLLADGDSIETKNLVWAAGITGKIYSGIPLTSYGKGKRMIADEYNKVTGVDDVFAIGDTCIQVHDQAFPAGHPQLAQVAIQQGVNLAGNFLAISKDKQLKSFKYNDKGTLAIVGRNKAVADLFKSKFHVGGFPALLVWLFIHLMGLVSWGNKFRTLYNWVVAYCTRDQSLRMIVRPTEAADQKLEGEAHGETVTDQQTIPAL